MLKRLFIFFLVLVFAPHSACTQQSSSLRHEILVLNVEKGLASRNVHTLIQDHKGMIWMATEAGLCVYNGLDVLIYNHHPSSNLTLPSAVISDIAEDNQGRLWVCTAKGLCIMSEDRSHLWSNQVLGIPDSIQGKGNCFIEPHPAGGFWILAGTSLFRIQVDQLGVRCQKVGTSPFSACDRMMASKKGELWLSSGTAIAIWKKNQFTQLDLPVVQGRAKFTLSEMYTEMINVLGDSITLIGTTNELFRLSLNQNNQSWTPESFFHHLSRSIPAYQRFLDYIKNLKNQHEKPILKNIVKDQQNNHWFLTNMGVYCVSSGRSALFQTIDVLDNQSMRRIFQDKNGNIWFNSYSGLTILNQNHQKIAFYPKPAGAWDIASLDTKDDYLLCSEGSTGLGQYHLSADTLHLRKAYSFHCVFDLEKNGDTIWMINNRSTFFGLDLKRQTLLQKIQFFSTSSQILYDELKSMVIDRNKNLWIAGAGGLFFLQKQANGLYQKRQDLVPKNLRNIAINTLYLDQNQQLWMGTKTDGLIRYNPSTQTITYYHLNEGLAHPTVFSIQGSNRDQLIWAGTQNGLSCLMVKTQQFFNFYENNGLPSNEFNTTAQLLAKNGILYMGSIKGVAYIDPRQLNLHATTEIRPYLELSVSNLNRHQSRTFYPEYGATVNLNSGLNYTSLRFFNSDASPAATACYYRYKIEGLLQEWRFAKSSERILLGHLKSGKYRLLLSIQIKGTWSKSYWITLRVPTPWYRHWWFYSLFSLAFLGTLYALYRLRVAQLRAQYQLRKQISDDLHDDLGTRIYALKSLAYQITQAGAKQYKLDELLTHFEKLSQETLLTIRNFIWAFDPKNDQLQDLMDRMEKFVNTAITPTVPDTSFVTFSNSSSHKMLPGTKYHGLRLFQELLTNMVKHTFSQKIIIDFQKDERFLLITVQNFYAELRKTEPHPEHYGQETMAHRIHEVGGQLSWQDEHNCQLATIRLPFA